MEDRTDKRKEFFAKWRKPTWVASVRHGASKVSTPACTPCHQLPKDYPAPREILRQHFPRTANQCLFRGDWGYGIDDAVAVSEFDPEINAEQRFDGVSLEYAFVDKRIREELLFAPAKCQRIDHLGWQVVEQSLFDVGGIPYDRLLVEVSVNDEVYQTEFWFNISEFF